MKQKIKNRFLIDFFVMTFKKSNNISPDQVLDFFCSFFKHQDLVSENFLLIDKGLPGYNRSYKFMGQNIISISWHTEFPDHGIMLNLTGQGCSFFKRDELIKFYKTCKEMEIEFNLSRLDIAYDDFHGLIPENQIAESIRNHVKDGNVISTHIRDYNMEIMEVNFAGQSGYNFNFGSRGSKFFLRIYDKRREQKLKNCDFWKRMEMQLRGEQAYSFMESLANSEKVQVAFVAMLDEKLRFTNGRYSVAGNAPSADFWVDFLKFLTSARFQNIRVAIDKMKMYI